MKEKHTYKFWIDRGEQLNEEDLVSGFDFECQAKDRYEAEDLFLREMEHALLLRDDGEGVTVFHSCNDRGWHRILMTRPPTTFLVHVIVPVTANMVREHFEVGK